MKFPLIRIPFTKATSLFALLIVVSLAGCASVPEVGMLADRDPAGHRIVIKLRAQKATLYKDGEIVGVAPVSTGREGYGTPAGKYTVLSKDIDHRSSLYGKYVKDGKTVKSGVDVRKEPKPPGVTFVGAPMPYYLQIAPAYGLHSGFVPGYPASHGCIRLPYRWAKRFFYATEVGTPVIIVR